ncbi:MAG TPA: M20 family metallopeptidase [Terriglobia bacterium]|nr:M20 family metallopeptidase [Terriglobia bacterium]
MPCSTTERALDLRPVLNWCTSQAEPMLRTLRQSVEIESPSQSKTAVTQMAEFFARELKRTGGKVQTYRHARAGAAVAAEFWGAPRQPQPILLLGHTDTVWDVSTLSQMPFRVERGRAYGPGILDMKSGLVVGLFAIRALRALNIKPRSSVRFFLNADEETGSTAFRSALLREARRARACLVLEPAAEGGAVKTARKGVGVFTLAVRGRSAHAGINPAAGVNAISELAKQIARIESFARPAAGLTVNVGVAQGGSRSNVVPETASASIDVRVTRARDGDWIEKKMRSLKPILRGARLEMTGGMNRPPLERRRTAALFECARGLASQLGFALHEASTGGGSDGSFVAALGVPTLDGLGGVGDGAHARHEHILVRELPRRAALLAALLATI